MVLGPTALLQFRAWEVGSVDLAALKEKLVQAVRHALCDIVTEYNMLTASVCQIPHQLMEILPATSYSTPSSPQMAPKGFYVPFTLCCVIFSHNTICEQPQIGRAHV